MAYHYVFVAFFFVVFMSLLLSELECLNGLPLFSCSIFPCGFVSLLLLEFQLLWLTVLNVQIIFQSLKFIYIFMSYMTANNLSFGFSTKQWILEFFIFANFLHEKMTSYVIGYPILWFGQFCMVYNPRNFHHLHRLVLSGPLVKDAFTLLSEGQFLCRFK